MKNRTFVGRYSDAAESSALYLPDQFSTERIYRACDWEYDKMMRERRIKDVLNLLAPSERLFAQGVLAGKSWQALGYREKSYFYKRLKKICKKISRKVATDPRFCQVIVGMA